ncbi:tigger transposable element-derived protein 4-like [Mizuhopecten yessoensis]|uniref:tigger transposable element-derived protein 4-like n=1 Tax=Mizuhopecten yessoensis TaxID=6573 RepID=UPI000B458349|nr:tigger transposable element-derived protein 4-like [Mizuhopecten yessoensis]
MTDMSIKTLWKIDESLDVSEASEGASPTTPTSQIGIPTASIMNDIGVKSPWKLDESPDANDLAEGASPSATMSKIVIENCVAILPEADETENESHVALGNIRSDLCIPDRAGLILASNGRYTVKRKLNVKSIETKYEAILAVERGNRRKSDIAKDFGIPSNTLSSWLKCADKIKNAFLNSTYGPERKKMRTGHFEYIEQALYKWYDEARRQNIPVSGTILKNIAGEIANSMGETNFKCSTGWLDRFKGRYAISFKNDKGKYFPSLCSQSHPNDIYNATETGLLYCILPNKESLATLNFPRAQNNDERFTLMVGTNMTGTDKLPLLVIGKEDNPFHSGNHTSLASCLKYVSTENVFMTSEIFTNWILDLDMKFHEKNRKVTLILDRNAVHPAIEGLKAISLVFVPATDRKLQPMNQGVLHHLKVQYRKNLITRQEQLQDTDLKINVKDAILLLDEAWNSVGPAKIFSCFKLSGIKSMDVEEGDIIPTTDEEDEDKNIILHSFDFQRILDEYARMDENISTCEPQTCRPTDDSGIVNSNSTTLEKYYASTFMTTGNSEVPTSRNVFDGRQADVGDHSFGGNLSQVLPVTDISDDNVMTMRNQNYGDSDHSIDTGHQQRSQSASEDNNHSSPSTMDAMQACVTLRAYLDAQNNTSELLETLAKISDRVMKEALVEHQSQQSTAGVEKSSRTSTSSSNSDRFHVKHENIDI